MFQIFEKKVASKKIFLWMNGACLFIFPVLARGAEISPQEPALSRENHLFESDHENNKWVPNLFFSDNRLKDDEEEEMEEYHGLGLTIKISGGWNYFLGGDIHRGTRAMFDQRGELISSQGYTTEYRKKSPCRSSLGLTTEAIYHLSPRIGVGVRASVSHAAHPNELKFYKVQFFPYLFWTDIDLRIVSFMVEFHYVISIHRRLGVFFNIGPELHLVSYQYAFNFTRISVHEEVNQKAKAKGVGGSANLGLELRLNPRVAVILELSGRFAEITNFKGKGALYYLENGLVSTSEANGYLYYSDSAEQPGLSILTEEASAGKALRRAVLDFSGVGLSAGMSFRF